MTEQTELIDQAAEQGQVPADWAVVVRQAVTDGLTAFLKDTTSPVELAILKAAKQAGMTGEIITDEPDLSEVVEATRRTAERGFQCGFSDAIRGLSSALPDELPASAKKQTSQATHSPGRPTSRSPAKKQTSYAYRQGYKSGWSAGLKRLMLDDLLDNLTKQVLDKSE